MTTAISPRAIAWRDIVGRLAATGAVMAEWRLVSGVTFYMYLPSSASTGTESRAGGLRISTELRYLRMLIYNCLL